MIQFKKNFYNNINSTYIASIRSSLYTFEHIPTINTSLTAIYNYSVVRYNITSYYPGIAPTPIYC